MLTRQEIEAMAMESSKEPINTAQQSVFILKIQNSHNA